MIPFKRLRDTNRSPYDPSNMKIESPMRPRDGSVLMTVLVVLPILLLMGVFAINVAYIQTVRTKVQIVADNSARAANVVYVATGDEALALDAANEMAALNPVESVVIPLNSTDLEFGLSQRNSKNKEFTFTPGKNGNSVRISTNSFSAGAGPSIVSPLPIFGFTQEIRPNAVAAHAQTTLDVAVIIDRSGSMVYAANETSETWDNPAAAPPGWAYGDPAPPSSRWLDLREAVAGFCDELDRSSKVEKVALCGYADASATHQILTEDYQLIINQLDILSNAFVGGSTNIGDGIIEGVHAVSDPKYARPWATNAMVLMSDGKHNTGTGPYNAIQFAVDKEIPVYTVSFSDEANKKLMRNLANETGGSYYHAADAAELNEAFRKIARELPSMIVQ